MFQCRLRGACTIDVGLDGRRFAGTLSNDLLPEKAIDDGQIVFRDGHVSHGVYVVECVE
jgi:hypothetical protein